MNETSTHPAPVPPQESPVKTPIIVVGVALSLVMLYRSIVSTEFGMFSIVYHLIMLAILLTPFLFIAFNKGLRSSPKRSVILTTLFAIGHSFFIYTTYSSHGGEFGYIGLVFVPIVESVIAIRASYLTAKIVGRSIR
jgi:hypothetical protein